MADPQWTYTTPLNTPDRVRFVFSAPVSLIAEKRRAILPRGAVGYWVLALNDQDVDRIAKMDAFLDQATPGQIAEFVARRSFSEADILSDLGFPLS